MDRKKIILSALLINAGLLVLLFLSALHHEEENVELPVLSQSFVFEPKTEERLPAPILSTESTLAGQPEPEIIHQLPPVQQVSPVLQPPSVARVVPPQEPPALLVSATPSGLPQGVEVVVKKGDTLDKIAKAHKTTIDELLRINQLQSTFLRVGQTLKIPAGKGVSSSVLPKEQGRETDYYIVKVGDTPWTIAQKHHIKVEELLKLNNLNSEKAKRLKPGDRLKIK